MHLSQALCASEAALSEEVRAASFFDRALLDRGANWETRKNPAGVSIREPTRGICPSRRILDRKWTRVIISVPGIFLFFLGGGDFRTEHRGVCILRVRRVRRVHLIWKRLNNALVHCLHAYLRGPNSRAARLHFVAVDPRVSLSKGKYKTNKEKKEQ